MSAAWVRLAQATVDGLRKTGQVGWFADDRRADMARGVCRTVERAAAQVPELLAAAGLTEPVAFEIAPFGWRRFHLTLPVGAGRISALAYFAADGRLTVDEWVALPQNLNPLVTRDLGQAAMWLMESYNPKRRK
jgi:hypothetical protein